MRARRRPSGELQEGNKQFGGPYWSAWLEPTRGWTPASARVYSLSYPDWASHKQKAGASRRSSAKSNVLVRASDEPRPKCIELLVRNPLESVPQLVVGQA
jgi:hypothetical protein